MKRNLICVLIIIKCSVLAQMPILRCLNDSITNQIQNVAPIICKADLESDQYIPTAETPTVVYRINFIFLLHPTIPTPFSGLTQGQRVDACILSRNLMNQKFQQCGSVNPILTPINPSPGVPDSKLRLDVQVYDIITPYAISNGFLLNGIEFFRNMFPIDTGSRLNVYIYTDSISGGGAVGNENGILMALSPGINFTINPEGLGAGTIFHELGHSLGGNTDYYKYAGPQLMPNNSDPVIIGYFPDDATSDVVTSYDCVVGGSVNPQANNNVMGNSGCRDWYSSRQIAAFHYRVAKNITRKYTQFSIGPYSYIPPSLASQGPLNLTGNLTFSNYIRTSTTLTIKTGANVTINNGVLDFMPQGKLIIEPGAKLTLNCVRVQPQHNIPFFGGIEVWGNNNAPQDFVGGVSANQGILEINNSLVTRAVTGVAAGRRLFFGAYVSGTGGGIIFSNSTTFYNNITAVEMIPHSYNPGLKKFSSQNLSTFDATFFNNTQNFIDNSGGSFFLVRLNGVNNVKFKGACQFFFQKASNSSDTTYCIKGINSSIHVKENCVFTGTKLNGGAFYGIHMVNSINKNTIEDNEFYTRNGIYLGNNVYDKVVRNFFFLDSMIQINNTFRTGLYLDMCNRYKVEKNTFQTVLNGGKPFSKGICVNSSGPYTNLIYNNDFYRLRLALWCQNQNYDPVFPVGLKLNCNDFYFNDYQIGVQSSMDINNGWNTGIALTQGIANAEDDKNVRNTYNSVPVCYNDNKFYSYTDFNQQALVTHGNFLGAAFSVTPTAGCSNPAEVFNWQVNTPTSSSNVYCTDISTFTLGIQGINTEISKLAGEIKNVENQLLAADGGSTQTLLNIIATNALSNGNLKNLLIAQPFLSDTVMINYFSKPNIPNGHAMQIHEKNAPVNRKVWQKILNQNFSNGIMANMNSNQNQQKLSAKNQLNAQLELLKNDLGYAVMHKTMFILDSSSVNDNPKDSIAALIKLLGEGDVKKQLIELDIRFADYDSAIVKLNLYPNSTNSLSVLYRDFMLQYITLMKAPAQLFAIESSSTAKVYVNSVATSSSHPCRLMARHILNFIYNRPYEIENLYPNETFAKQSNVVETSETYLENPDENIFIFPNPASNEIKVKNNSSKNYELRIFNISGQLLVEQNVKANEITQINTAILPNGIYFVNLTNEYGFIKTQKLIIAH